MFERPSGGEGAILVHIGIGQPPDPDQVQEFNHLASSAGAEVLGSLIAQRQSPDPRFFAGSGKVEELAGLLEASGAELVIFDNPLSPSQERNLEGRLKCRVLDRTGLILDVFAQRARSFEGMLQVELAQLRHLSTRLVRGWTHLERQKGGIGLRGPGETQLETDRRLLGKRIALLRERLAKVERQREQVRRSRTKAEVPTVALVGYTNAGKSSLFNALTSAQVYAADQLFATLDPTLRRLELGPGHLVLADTVGFISQLPHELVAAFRSTLRETVEADLLIHVVDAANPARDAQIVEVESVLRQIGADQLPQLQVFNKIDLLAEVQPHLDLSEEGRPSRIWLSARQGPDANEGLALLRKALAKWFFEDEEDFYCRLGPEQGRLRALLYSKGLVRSEEVLDVGDWLLELRMSRRQWERFLAQEPELACCMG